LVTAFPDEISRLRAMAAGAFGYLGKPFSEESLLKCLDTALGSLDEKFSRT
jgi:CheY-like chemotaxis protein